MTLQEEERREEGKQPSATLELQVLTCRCPPPPAGPAVPTAEQTPAQTRGSPPPQATLCRLQSERLQRDCRNAQTSRRTDGIRATQVQSVLQVPHGVGHLCQPRVDLVHAGVDPSEGRNVEQLLEVGHYGAQSVGGGVPELLENRAE